MRRDIQLLRGVAVLLVVIFHADIGIFTEGFLGVDIFFVISGFLITTIILKGLGRNNFSFTSFYLRRAKRLLPALYCTLIVTTLLAYSFITYSQQKDFIVQLLGALTFSANMVLPTQLGYFDGDAKGKVLLHIWSLSLEEQYYFFLPLLLFVIPKITRIWFLIVLTAGSLIWCLNWVVSDSVPPLLWRIADSSRSEWAFFLFPTRAWELLAGSICAWIMLNKPVTVNSLIKWLALTVILVVGWIQVDTVHPRAGAIIVVLATSLIMLGEHQWLPEWKIIQSIEKIGDWSYSIYLVHWPLFAFAYLGFVGTIPLPIKFLLIIVSIVLGIIQFRLVETPFRYGWKSKPSAAWSGFSLATLAVILVPAPMFSDQLFSNEINKYQEIRKINYGLSPNCDGEQINNLHPECSTTNQPIIAIWGDSYAMHLVPGLIKKNANIIQLTKSVCGPLLNIAIITEKYNEKWAKKCINFNNDAYQKIISTPSIKYVVLSSTFVQYFKNNNDQFLLNDNIISKDINLAVKAFINTIEKLKAAKKVPILFSPPPRAGFNIGECLEREQSDFVLFKENCNIPVWQYLEHEKEIHMALQQVINQTKIHTIWLDSLLCDKKLCKTKLNNSFIYRDSGHLSITGSEKLLGNIQLKKLLDEKITTVNQ
jgi:peptidoglycan/LPS O-acetylase OafA/YrhL